MLVLALQFSRSGDQRVRSGVTRRSGAWRGIGSLKTEEKTAVADGTDRGRKTYDLCRLPATTHQCTNWEWQLRSWRSATRKLQCSLERR
jgi:hypothetical protein